MSTRHRNLTRNDIANAFREAKQGDDTILAFTDHDFRDMQQHIESVWNKITAVSETFENVDFEYRTAVEAMREVIGMDSLSKPGLTIDRLSYNDTPVIQVNAENKIFGKQPYLAIKTTSGEYYWQNFDFPKEDVWTFTFDFHTIPEHAVECVGIAANSPLGVTEVINWDPNTQTADTTYWNVSNQ